MTNFLRAAGAGLAFACALMAAGCTNQTENTTPANTATTTNTTTTTTTAPLPSPPTAPSPASQAQQANAAPLTLPVLDAFFADESFPKELKSSLQLTDDQINKLRTIAREETARLSESSAEQQGSGRTASARTRAAEQIKAVIGEEKTQQLAALVRERWSGGGEDNASNTGPNTGASPGTAATNGAGPNAASGKAFNAVPADTRIVVNAPAYRMDVFENGRLVKTYKVGIGYPEFPLPTGLRKASDIIFNPTWTPPDSPWVATMKKVKAGEKVEAGSKLNPLGPIKIPIGLPSLIHGGKSPAKIGGFASHGCVGLTNPQVQDFARMLGQIGGANLTDADIANYAKNKTETKDVKLAHSVPVELRYETIVVEDGKLHVYRDVYDHNTNTEENLRAVLTQYGVTLDQLSEQERAQVLQALKDMSHDAGGQSAANSAPDKSGANKNAARTSHVTRTVKGKKEVVIEIAALKGKGYPAPVNANAGGAAPKSATPATNKTGKRP
ncbi:MAG TPA: L,D-transpeptidase [Pyrinomonadaceae bacterium]|nr:L,D-transpeptidase [Pyrinomonadaceae bacterium]